MGALLSVLLALVSLLFPLPSAFAQSDLEPPTALIFGDDFSPISSAWQPVSGRWAAANGTYNDSLAGSTDITTITLYEGLGVADPGHSQIDHPEYFVRARMRNQGTDDTHLVGLVYGYQDAQNYYEVVVSALGTVTMRTVMNGIAVDEAPAFHSNIPRSTWLEVEVRWNRGVSSLKVNGRSVFTGISQPEFEVGQAGLVTHRAVGRFDKVLVGVPFGDQPFLETFDDSPFVTFMPQSGQWSVVNGTYRNSAVQQTNITLAPIHTGLRPGLGDTFGFTFRARMLNPYGASGNLVGVLFNYLTSDYTEVVFSPTGIVKLNRFENGRVRTVATESYGGRPNVPFELAMENGPNRIVITVDGKPIFANVSVFDVNPAQVPEGGVGLITHWAPGRFDNVQFDHWVFQPCSRTFEDEPTLPNEIVSGTWDIDGGTLNSTAVGQSDIVSLFCTGNIVGEHAGTNFVYSARLLNEYSASGNLVGLLYNYQDSTFYAGDYFEIVLSPTGIMQLNKFIQGVRYPVATRTHNIPRNTWFDVQVIRSGILTEIKLNGATVLQGLPQGELQGGNIGVITHWSKGRFDNVTLTPHVSRPPSQL